MTDVLYIVGRGSAHDNAELRWSINGLKLHAKNLGRIIVAGYPPGWLPPDVVRFPREDDPCATGKHVNILNTILAAIDAGVVTGKFLYSSDDHFLFRDVDLDAYPVWFSAERLKSVTDLRLEGTKINNHRLSLAATRAALEGAGYEAVSYNTHANTWMDAADAPAVRQVVEDGDRLGLRFGYEPTCLFANIRQKREPFPSVFRKDVKLTSFAGPDLVWKDIPSANDEFSISDRCFDSPDFVPWMNALFPAPSKSSAAPSAIPAARAAKGCAYAFCATGERYTAMADFAKASLLHNIPDAEIVDIDPLSLPPLFSPLSEAERPYFARLAIPLLPQFRKYRRVVWLDCDVEIVSPKFADIFSADTGANGVAAVVDPSSDMCAARLRSNYPAYARSVYYNTGIALFDLEKIDTEKWISRLEPLIKYHIAHPFRWKDQCILNAAMDLAPLEKRFNVFWRERDAHPDAALIHYTPNSGKAAMEQRMKELSK